MTSITHVGQAWRAEQAKPAAGFFPWTTVAAVAAAILAAIFLLMTRAAPPEGLSGDPAAGIAALD